MSTKTKIRNTGPSSNVVEAVLDRACYCCEVCGSPCADQRGTDWSIHHRRPRGMGGTRWPGINSPANLMLVCGSGTTLCHGVIENYRAGAVAAGWLVLSRTDPACVAVLITHDRWLYLTADGEYADNPTGRCAMTLPEPSVCETCSGTRVQSPQWLDCCLGHWRTEPCLDCCCPCGRYTGGGFCERCEEQDWIDCELSYQRGADR